MFCWVKGVPSGHQTILFNLKNNKSPPKSWILHHAIVDTATAAAKSLQSCPTLCDPKDGSPQVPPSLGFFRQEHWSGLPFPSPMPESEVTQSCPTVHDPMDCSPPGSPVHGISQARVLEWSATAFSYNWYDSTLTTLGLQGRKMTTKFL